MSNERNRVLDLLEQGKITTEEAIKLLDALGVKPTKLNQEFSDEFEEKLQKFSQSIESFAREIGDKINVVAKEVEPKVRDATVKIMEKTARFADDIAKSIYREDDCCDNNGQCCNYEQCCDEEKCCDDTAQSDSSTENCCCEKSEDSDKPIPN